MEPGDAWFLDSPQQYRLSSICVPLPRRWNDWNDWILVDSDQYLLKLRRYSVVVDPLSSKHYLPMLRASSGPRESTGCTLLTKSRSSCRSILYEDVDFVRSSVSVVTPLFDVHSTHPPVVTHF